MQAPCLRALACYDPEITDIRRREINVFRGLGRIGKENIRDYQGGRGNSAQKSAGPNGGSSHKPEEQGTSRNLQEVHELISTEEKEIRQSKKIIEDVYERD